jgi:uncharacterized protein
MHQETVSFVEIGTADASKTGPFFAQLLGWQFHPLGAQSEGWYQTASIKLGMHGNDPSPGFLLFFGVPDLEAAITKVVSLGGKAEIPTEEPGFGRFCFCTDPSGLKFGIHSLSSNIG